MKLFNRITIGLFIITLGFIFITQNTIAGELSSLGRYKGSNTIESRDKCEISPQFDPSWHDDGLFEIYFSIEPNKRKRSPQADLYEMKLNISPKDYEDLFESSRSISNRKLYHFTYSQYASTKQKSNGSRQIKIIQKSNPENGRPITRMGKLTITVKNSLIKKFRMEKWHRKRNNRFSKIYDNTFKVRRTNKGLGITNGARVLRYVTSRDEIDSLVEWLIDLSG